MCIHFLLLAIVLLFWKIIPKIKEMKKVFCCLNSATEISMISYFLMLEHLYNQTLL